ncbi:MAG: UvrD-helicase domain-containing protein [Deltaproteobacteria bacterium]|nr:UvrD-helicase domain-containing protein [Deltaproteobacteria bacterium]
MSRFIEDLNNRQRETVETLSGPMLVLAGAGSGKTRVLTRRIANLIENGVYPHRIIAVTFTNKAAKEMQQRVNELLGDGAMGLWMGTFHSIAARLLRIYGNEAGIDPDFVIYDADDQKSIIKRILKDRSMEVDASVLRNTIALFENYRRKSIPKLYAPWNEIYKKYMETLVESKAVDFTGLIEYGAKLQSVISTLWDHVLVDEFQDTSNIQFEFLRQMVGKDRNICVVGDDDQSIYSWRGANPEYLLKFEKEFPGARKIKLEENYRSTGYIIRAASSLISKNTVRHDKTLRTMAPDGDKLTLVRLDNGRLEARWVIARINLLSESGVSLSDIAVLYRINALSRALEEELTRNGINYRLIGGLKFYERAEIKDIISYLRLAVSRDSENDILRVMNTPRRGIGQSSIEKIRAVQKTDKISLWDALKSPMAEISGSARKGILEFVSIVEELSSLAQNEHPVVILTHLMEATSWLGMKGSEDPDEQSRFENMIQLQQSFEERHQEIPDQLLHGFLDEISLLSGEDQPQGEDGVTLMTIHSAKGLEFDHVFLPGWEDGVFPMKRKDEEVNIEEERRLAYVSITRARKRVYISCALERSVWGPPIPAKPSPFIRELPLDCLDWEGIVRKSSSSEESSRQSYKNSVSSQRATGRRNISPSSALKDVSEKVESDGFAPGVFVNHVKFGHGRIISVVGEGKMRKAIVKFQNGESKVIITSFLKKA